MYVFMSTDLGWDFTPRAQPGKVVLGIVGGQTPEIASVLVGPYLVLCLAFLTPKWFRMPLRMGDYSYGVYIYAFPIQQTISLVLAPISGWVMFGYSAMPLTLASFGRFVAFRRTPSTCPEEPRSVQNPPPGPRAEPSRDLGDQFGEVSEDRSDPGHR